MNATPSQPKLVRTVVDLRRALGPVRAAGRKIGLVPTMGALHEGHLSLVRAAQAECGYTVVTIFVNPAQFGPSEDYQQYPRRLETDLEALGRLEVPLVFAPPEEEVYRPDHATWVEVESVARRWEGECRPGHFRGVATIVLKLFNMVGADVAYFGQKDYQQLLVIRRMVEDLNVPIQLRTCPTVREPDGLAMSSRNAYLKGDARQRALVLWKSLQLARQLVAEGGRDAVAIVERMRRMIAQTKGASIDYVTIVDPHTLEPVDRITSTALAAVAVRIDDTRLIDNCLLEPLGG
ncbi:MAG TPA: pantoate--beta-alanine ligase [Planctomycetaceae bacterium]|nr:pantoate--beta-alanine ligase [Planctomycetaceae bacterium]